MSEKDRLESLRDRDKRNKDKGTTTDTTVDRYRDLRNWSEYAGQLRPAVDILALPESTASGKSMFLSAITAVASQGIVSTPLNYKFKADFYSMKLLCDGAEITPLQRSKVEFGAFRQRALLELFIFACQTEKNLVIINFPIEGRIGVIG